MDIPELLPGDLLWTRSEGVVGSLIRLQERIKYHGWLKALKLMVQSIFSKGVPEPEDDTSWGNHIAVYVGNGDVIEALARGIVVTPVSHYTVTQYRILSLASVRPGVTDADRERVVTFATQEMEKKLQYGWPSIGSIILDTITPLTLSISWGGAIICSALGAMCWTMAGVNLPFKDAYTVTPADLAVFVEQVTHSPLTSFSGFPVPTNDSPPES